MDPGFRLQTCERHRKQGIADGPQWFEPNERPSSWDLNPQLKGIPSDYRKQAVS